MAIVNFPILYFPDPTQGRPLWNGQIYIGQPDLDPTIPANQKTVRFVQEDGTLVATTQPIVVGVGGVPVYNGSPVRLDVDGNFSIKVLDRLGVQAYYIENVYEGTPIIVEDLQQYISAEFATVSALISGSALNYSETIDWADYLGRNVRTVANNTTSNKGGAWYTIKTVAQAAADGDVIDGTGAPNYYGANHALDVGTHVAILNQDGEISVTQCGAAGIGNSVDDTASFSAAIATGLDVLVPDTSSYYYITGAVTRLSRWQSIRGQGYTRVVVDASASDYDAFTISTDNVFEGLYVEGTGTSNCTGLAVSKGSLSTDFASTCTIRNCWFRIFKVGARFDNAFTMDIYGTQFRQCATGTLMSPVITDIPTEQYLANISFYTCRWNGNAVNDINLVVSDNSRCRGVNFYGCTLDPMAGSATESVVLTKAALVSFDGCYLEADTSAVVKQIVATNSVFLSLRNCVMTGTGGIELISSQMDIHNTWSFSAVSPDAEDPILADANSVLRITQSTFRSTAHNFLNASRVTLTDATIRIAGTIQYVEFTQYRNGVPSFDEGISIPSYTPEVGAFTTITYDTNNTEVRWTKNGKLVSFTAVIRTTAVDATGASGDVYVDLNIPYSSSLDAYRSVAVPSEVGVFGAFVNSPSSGYTKPGDNTIKLFYRSTSSGGDIALNVTDLDTAAGSRNFMQITGSFFTD